MNRSRLPSISGRALIRALRRAGFEIVRVKGSHHVLRHSDDARRQTVVPVHASKDLGKGMLAKILNEAGLTLEDLDDLL